jgi:glyoxylase-like metal-dependent hydrolase (beta-lactamase superfamily II)
VCDPIDDPDQYIRVAQENGLHIRYVIDTHLHADHVSGGRRLAEMACAEYVLHESADTQYGFRRVRDGEVLELGNVKIQVLHTPGHTPEHISLLVTDKSRGPEPWFLLTGHTLMVGDVGRTELATESVAGATQLFETIQRLKQFPEYLEILPGAYAGSVCGRALSGKAVSTLGFERRFNRAFQISTVEQFVEFMLQSIPAPPPNATAVRALNQGRAA